MLKADTKLTAMHNRDAEGVEVVTPEEEKRIWDVSNQFNRFQMNNL
jgi:hypothetical protein